MVTAEHLIDALELYVNEEIISKVAGLKKWALWALARPLLCEYMKKAEPVLLQLGFMREDGMIDADKLLQKLGEAASSQGAVTEHIALLNADITFSGHDVEKLKILLG